MEIKFITEKDYELWDGFCNENTFSTFFHTTSAMEYFINCSFNVKTQQKSFMVYENNNIIACMPVFIENINGENNLSYGGGSLLTPLIDERLNKAARKKVMSLIMKELDQIAYLNNVKKISMYIAYLNDKYINTRGKYNYLLKYGYLDASNYTCILDLQVCEKDLFKNFTKGHKSDIKKAEKNLKLEIINNENATKDQVYDFMEYYFKIAGKKTRPVSTFDKIYKWTKKDFGVLFKATYNNESCGYSFYSIYKDTAYYYMACKDNRCENFNVAHFLQWEAIKYLKYNNIKYLELGIQDFDDTLGNFPSEKDKNISKFKRGFGGFIIPVFKGEKFYEKDAFIKCYEERIRKYVERNF